MKPDAIDPESGHAASDFFRIGVGGKIGTKGGIDAEYPKAIFPLKEMSLPGNHEASAAGRLIEEIAYVGNARAGIVPGKHEWKQRLHRLGGGLIRGRIRGICDCGGNEQEEEGEEKLVDDYESRL